MVLGAVQDLSYEAAANLLLVLSKLPSIAALDDLKDSIDVDFPEDLEETKVGGSVKVPDGVDPAFMSYFNYDEAHSGRFSTFGTEGATIEPDHVINREEPLKFIRDNVAFGSLEGQKECCVFVQGLRTASQPEELVPGMIASQRIECYSDTLNGLRIAQVHTGTNLDQKNAKVNVNETYALRALTMVLKLTGSDVGQPNEDGDIEVPPTAFDITQAVLSGKSLVDTPIKKTLRKLFRVATPESPLTLMVYSRGSLECNAALKEYIKAQPDQEATFKHLRSSVTVLTIGSATGGWPDGPAYIHLSSWEDKLPRMFCNANRNGTAGADAVFLHNYSPYPDKFDSHNFQAGTSQFLTVVMMASKVSTLRELWELGQQDPTVMGRSGGGGDSVGQAFTACEGFIGTIKECMGKSASPVGGGDIVIPDNIDELTDAMIALTDGHKYLWDDASVEVANSFRPLPDKETAKETLKASLPDYADKIDTIAEKFETRAY